MPDIFIKLKNRSHNVLLASILGSYSHLMWVRTEDPLNKLVRIATTDDLYDDAIKVLEKIRPDVDYDFVKIDNEHG